jgi:hypothetical protein
VPVIAAWRVAVEPVLCKYISSVGIALGSGLGVRIGVAVGTGVGVGAGVGKGRGFPAIGEIQIKSMIAVMSRLNSFILAIRTPGLPLVILFHPSGDIG